MTTFYKVATAHLQSELQQFERTAIPLELDLAVPKRSNLQNVARESVVQLIPRRSRSRTAINSEFFRAPTSGSKAKTRIVSKYFWAWAKVLDKHLGPRGRLQYLDLFAGRGCYDDGTISTPLLVLQKTIEDPTFRQFVIARLNDSNPENSNALQRAIRSLERFETLVELPIVENRVVDEEMVREFETLRLPPTLSFLDPWGYKGLSVRMIRALTKDWGCDCIFFFNYNRINLALSNPFVTEPVDEWFGRTRAETLRGRIEGLSPRDRERMVLGELKQAITEGSQRRILEFAFKFDNSCRTSHYIVLVTKRAVGFEIMKKILAKESSEAPQGIPGFTFNPTCLLWAQVQSEQLSFFGYSEQPKPLQALGERLLERFAGRTVLMKDVYWEYNREDDRYIGRNYKDALLLLEAEGAISCDPPICRRQRHRDAPTMGDSVRITFPMQERAGE